MNIKIENYINASEIKNILEDELRLQIREHFKNEENARRLLSNLSYHIVSEEVDKIVPNHIDVIVEKVSKLITEKDLSYHVYNFEYLTGKPFSLGAKLIEQTVKENQEIIKDKVVKTIQEANYNENALLKFESLAENFTHNIYDFVELMRNKK